MNADGVIPIASGQGRPAGGAMVAAGRPEMLPGESLIRSEPARLEAVAGLLAVTSHGVRFLPDDGTTESLFVAASTLRNARRTDSGEVLVSARGVDHWFGDVGDRRAATITAHVIAQLVLAGAAEAAALSQMYAGAPPPVAVQQGAPRRHWGAEFLEAPTPIDLRRVLAITSRGIALVCIVALLWAFGASSVSIPDPLGGDLYDCGTAGGAYWRSLDNETGTVFEAAFDEECGRAGSRQLLPVALGVALIIGLQGALGRSDLASRGAVAIDDVRTDRFQDSRQAAVGARLALGGGVIRTSVSADDLLDRVAATPGWTVTERNANTVAIELAGDREVPAQVTVQVGTVDGESEVQMIVVGTGRVSGRIDTAGLEPAMHLLGFIRQRDPGWRPA